MKTVILILSSIAVIGIIIAVAANNFHLSTLSNGNSIF